MISILMSAYNCEKFISESIESILNQSYSNFELIIIDDASTDGTSKIINTFNDNRIKYIRNERNMGLTVNLNIAISLAKGEYIARMDADDISLPNRLEKQIKFLNDNPQVGVLGSNAIEIGQSKRITVSTKT